MVFPNRSYNAGSIGLNRNFVRSTLTEIESERGCGDIDLYQFRDIYFYSI